MSKSIYCIETFLWIISYDNCLEWQMWLSKIYLSW